MKAKLFIGLAVATVAIAATTVFAVNHFSPKSHLSDLALQNLEAITQGEHLENSCIANNCRWSPYNYCYYTCNGYEFSSSNMRNK
jgi:hypothetical protein